MAAKCNRSDGAPPAMAAISWYGPLIDLSSASSHLTGYVQLLVFVHRSTPIQYKPSTGGTVVRTDIQVGDDTRPFFSVSLWGKQLSSSVSAGDVVLLQNVKIARYGSILEARTVQYSSILSLVHPYESLFSKGANELVGSCRIGTTVKEKLRKVIEWVQQQKATLHAEMCSYKGKAAAKNWKVQEEEKLSRCQMLSEVLHLRVSSKAVFRASVGEIFLPFLQFETEKERMFLSKRLMNEREGIVEDIICTGCQLCSCPLDLGSLSKQKSGHFFCEKSSNHQHSLGMIYKPFMLYVWDELGYMPILVKNKAAQLLFGNIKAEKVYQSHKDGDTVHRSLNFFMIWLVLLKMLLLQGKNSPLEFVVLVSPGLEIEDGRFEMVSVSMPCL